MDDEMKRLDTAFKQATENLMAFLRETFGKEDDPRAIEMLRLTSLKEVAEDALVTYMLDTMDLEEASEPPPPTVRKPSSGNGERFLH
jgi:hypothetical protein